MNYLKQNSQQENPGSTTNYPDDQEGPFLNFLIPARLQTKQPTEETVSPNLFEFLGHLFPPKPRYQFYVEENSTIH